MIKKTLLLFFIFINTELLRAEESNFVSNTTASLSFIFNTFTQNFTTATTYQSDSIGYRCSGGGTPSVDISINNTTDGTDIYTQTARTLTCDDTAQTLSLGATYSIPTGKNLTLEFTHNGDDIDFKYQDATNPYPNGDVVDNIGFGLFDAGDDLHFAIFEIPAVPAIPTNSTTNNISVKVPISPFIYLFLALSILFIGAKQSQR